MYKVAITTYPFGFPNDKPIKILSGLDVSYNQKKRKYTREELIEVLKQRQPDIIIAGTEDYKNTEILDLVPNLQLISRVGIGLDGLDLEECRRRGITVAYTPDAPSSAVAELALGQMFNALRHIRDVDNDIRIGKWNRYIGREIRSCNIGIIGMGRIGRLVASKLIGLKPRRIFINDIIPERVVGIDRCEAGTKSQILCEADIISIHIPYTAANHWFINELDFGLMKKDAIIINMSRGNIINEDALYNWLTLNTEAFGIIDTFVNEPYKGKLRDLANTSLTPHLASCTLKSRLAMEAGAAEAVLDFIQKKPLANQVV